MKLKICCDLPEGESLYIKVKDETKILSHLDEFVEFDVSEHTTHIIAEIERKPDKSNRRFIDVLFFIITILIQGALNCIFISDNHKWYNDITPYGLKAKINIDLSCNTTINLIYTKSKLLSDNGQCYKPTLHTNDGDIESINYIANHNSYKNCYFNYVKRVVSVFSILLVVLVILFIAAINNGYTFAVIITMIVALGMAGVVSWVSASQYKKLKHLIKSFESDFKG